MTTFEEYAAAASRTPCGLLILTLDTCANTFGVAPCVASGEACYNTWCTCRDQANYSRTTRDYEYTSFDAAPLPLVGPRPYLKSAKAYAAEIKVDGKGGSKGTLTGRYTFDLLDEPDNDVGLDPYLSSRSAMITASYWRRLLARNPNYLLRPARYYEGFVGLPRPAWQQRWLGDIEEITLGNGVVSLKTVDQLKRLDNINIPAKISVTLVGDVTAVQDTLVLSTLTGLAAAGTVRIEDELITYTGTIPAQNTLTGCSRGVANTTAASHRGGDKIALALRLAGNPFDLLQTLLIDYAGIAPTDINGAAFTYWKSYPEPEPTFATWLVESTKLAEIFWELVDLLDAQVWLDEEQKITCARTLPNLPGRGYTPISDAANIVKGSLKVDLNAESRQSQIVVNWDKNALGATDKEASYNRVTVAIDGPSTGANGNGLVVRTLPHRWIDLASLQEEIATGYIDSLAYRRLWRWADPHALIDFELELKDGAIRSGDYVRLSTSALVDTAGAALANVVAQVVKRAQGKGKNLALKVWRTPHKRVAIIAPDGTPDYAAASEAQQEYGFIASDDGRMDDLNFGYHIW